MKASNDLFALIQSLTKSEKRYFKLRTNSKSAEKNYLKLFDFLDKQSVYNEEKILRKFKQEKFVKSLHVTKKYLYDLILSTLRDFHEKQDIEGALSGLLFNARLLEKKGLYEQSRRVLDSVCKKSRQYDVKLVLMEALQLKIKLSIMLTLKKRQEEVENLYVELDEVVEAFLTEQKIRAAKDIVFLHLRKRGRLQKGENENYLDQWIDPIKRMDEPDNFWGKLYYHSILGHHNKLLKEHKNCFKHYHRIMEVWEAHPHMTTPYMTKYLVSYSNFLASTFNLGDYPLLKQSLEKLDQLKTLSLDDSSEKYWMECLYWILYALNAPDFDKGYEVVQSIEEQGDQYKSKLIKGTELILYSNIRYLFFHSQQYDKALQWNYKIISDPKAEISEHIRRASHIFQLPIHYSLGNFELLDNLVVSVRRYLNRNKEMSEVEDRILSLFGQLSSQVHTKMERKQLLDDYLSMEGIDAPPSVLLSLREWSKSLADIANS